MSSASYQPIWYWQSLNVEYRFRDTCWNKSPMVVEKINCRTWYLLDWYKNSYWSKKKHLTNEAFFLSCEQMKKKYRKNAYIPNSLIFKFADDMPVELVSKELNHFGSIADLFRQFGGQSNRFVLFCSFWRLFTVNMIKRVKVFLFTIWKLITIFFYFIKFKPQA